MTDIKHNIKLYTIFYGILSIEDRVKSIREKLLFILNPKVILLVSCHSSAIKLRMKVVALIQIPVSTLTAFPE